MGQVEGDGMAAGGGGGGAGREGAGYKPDSAGWRLALTGWPDGDMAGMTRRAIVRGSWPERPHPGGLLVLFWTN